MQAQRQDAVPHPVQWGTGAGPEVTWQAQALGRIYVTFLMKRGRGKNANAFKRLSNVGGLVVCEERLRNSDVWSPNLNSCLVSNVRYIGIIWLYYVSNVKVSKHCCTEQEVWDTIGVDGPLALLDLDSYFEAPVPGILGFQEFLAS